MPPRSRYSSNQIRAAISNALALGTVDPGDLEQMKVDLADTIRQEQEDYAREQAQQQAYEKRSALSRFGGAMQSGWDTVAMNVDDIVGNIPGLQNLKPTPEQWEEKRFADRPYQTDKAGAIGQFVGENLATALPVSAAGKAATLIPKVGKYLKGPIAQGILQGALGGAIQAGPENRAYGAAVGGVMGGGFGGAARAARGLFRGYVKPTPSAQYLIDRGMGENMTYGRMRHSHFAGTAEDAATSFPVIGPFASRRLQPGIKDYNLGQAAPAVPAGSTLNLKAYGTPTQKSSAMITALKNEIQNGYRELEGYPVVAGLTTDELSTILRTPLPGPNRFIPVDEALNMVVQVRGPQVWADLASPAARNVAAGLNRAGQTIKGSAVSPMLAQAGATKSAALFNGPIRDSASLLEAIHGINLYGMKIPATAEGARAQKIIARNAMQVLEHIIDRDVPNGGRVVGLGKNYAELQLLRGAVTRGRKHSNKVFMPVDYMDTLKKKLGDRWADEAGGEAQRLVEAAHDVYKPSLRFTNARRFFSTKDVTGIIGGPFLPLISSPTYAKVMSGRTGWQRALQGLENKYLLNRLRGGLDTANFAAGTLSGIGGATTANRHSTEGSIGSENARLTANLLRRMQEEEAAANPEQYQPRVPLPAAPTEEELLRSLLEELQQ